MPAVRCDVLHQDMFGEIAIGDARAWLCLSLACVCFYAKCVRALNLIEGGCQLN